MITKIAALGQVLVAHMAKRLIIGRLTLLTSNAIKPYMLLAANGFHSDSLAGGKKSGEKI